MIKNCQKSKVNNISKHFYKICFLFFSYFYLLNLFICFTATETLKISTITNFIYHKKPNFKYIYFFCYLLLYMFSYLFFNVIKNLNFCYICLFEYSYLLTKSINFV